LGKGAQDTWRLSWPCGGRLDKTGVTPRQVMRRGWRQTRMAGVYTDQRLNLSKLGKACGRKPRFQTGPGKSGRPGVCPGKASVFSRRQTCRGRSQSPVVRIAKGRKQNLRSLSTRSPKGRSRVIGPYQKRTHCGLERSRSEGRACFRRAKAA
jgi:hypothetical protein